MDKIHMRQRSGLFGEGWALCGKSMYAKRTHTWKRVTCKLCLRHKKPKEKRKYEK